MGDIATNRYTQQTMIIRLVRMQFQEQHVKEFLDIFVRHKHAIRDFAGCTHLELVKDINLKDCYWTLSTWESVGNLEAYRQSELFKQVWQKVKPMFREKAAAFSVEKFMES